MGLCDFMLDYICIIFPVSIGGSFVIHSDSFLLYAFPRSLPFRKTNLNITAAQPKRLSLHSELVLVQEIGGLYTALGRIIRKRKYARCTYSTNNFFTSKTSLTSTSSPLLYALWLPVAMQLSRKADITWLELSLTSRILAKLKNNSSKEGQKEVERETSYLIPFGHWQGNVHHEGFSSADTGPLAQWHC